MSEFKGTKGEWKYSIHNGRIIFNKPNMDLWFHDEGNNFKEEPKEVLANAKLIAAAPDMLMALQKILDYDLEEVYPGFNKDTGINKAINKALK